MGVVGLTKIGSFGRWNVIYSNGTDKPVAIHVAYHYMGYHGRTWDLRKNNKKVKKNRIPL